MFLAGAQHLDAVKVEQSTSGVKSESEMTDSSR
jgi:hypothetical protein